MSIILRINTSSTLGFVCYVEIDVSFLFNWYQKQNSVCELKFMGLWKPFVKIYSFKYFLRLKILIYFFTSIHFILHRYNILIL